MIFYFSGTGNSAWVARNLAERLQDKVFSIGEDVTASHDYGFANHEKIGFVFPVYAWGPPLIVLDFLKRLRLPTPEYVYFVCTCGDDTGRTAEIFASSIHQKGWECNAGFSVTMPNTYVSLPGFDIDDPDAERIKVFNAISRIQFIAQEVGRSIQHSSYNCHEGVFPRLKSYVIRPFFTHFLMKVSPFHASDECIACGRCVSVCPLKNINLLDGHPVWGDVCAHCLACYHACPKHAVAYGNRTQGKGQYKGEHLV